MRSAERNILFDPPAGFDDPLEMLLGCHRRIEKQLETLRRLRAHLDANGVDAEASAAAQAVLKYFTQAAANHHHDEEHDLNKGAVSLELSPYDARWFRVRRPGQRLPP